MPMENETANIVNNSNDRQQEVQAAYEKGRRVGRIEGMIAYQKHLVGNLQKENEKFVKQLADITA